MKICVLSTHPLQDNRIYKMITTINTKQNEVIYINISTQTQIPVGWFAGVKIYQFPIDFRKNNIFKLIPIYKKISKILRKEKPNVVHVHDPYLIPLLVTAKHNNAITVYDKHEAYEVMRGFAAESGTWCERIFNKYIDGIVYVAKSQEQYINQFHYLGKKLIPNYQLSKLYSSSPKIAHEGVKLFYAGDLSEDSRNTLLMLDLVKKVLLSHKEVTCIIAGKVSDSSVLEKISELEQECVRFQYLDYILYDDVIRETCSSDIGMYLTKYDPNNVGSSPNKINEYLIAGIAILAQGRFQDWEIINNNAGLVFDYIDDFETIYSGLERMVEDSILLKNMKYKSAELGKDRSWEMVGTQYIELYDELISKSGDQNV